MASKSSLFVADITQREQATMLIPNDLTKTVARKNPLAWSCPATSLCPA
jgi:hypothetical protein